MQRGPYHVLSNTQDEEPRARHSIDKVGVEGIRACLRLVGNGDGSSTYFPLVSVMIDLSVDRKGVHMSRLVESINEVVNDGAEEAKKSFEDAGVDIIKALKKKHPFSRAEVILRTSILLPKTTPVTRRVTNEAYNAVVKVFMKDEIFSKYLEVKVIGNTVCPHSMNMTDGKAHIQRAKLSLGVHTGIDAEVDLEALVDICEGSLSSPTYTMLKSPDEAFLVEKMYNNPKFVEDVVRDCYEGLCRTNLKGRAKIRAIAYESIHKHNAVSEIVREIVPTNSWDDLKDGDKR